MHYSESKSHKYLKKLAKEYLLSQNYKETQISENLEIIIGNKKLTIDIVGVNKTESIAIECGQTQPEKLQILKFYFTQTIHIPYGTIILTEERLQLEIEKNKLQKEKDNLEQIKQQIKDKTFNELRDFYCKRCSNRVKKTESIRSTLINNKKYTF